MGIEQCHGDLVKHLDWRPPIQIPTGQSAVLMNQTVRDGRLKWDAHSIYDAWNAVKQNPQWVERKDSCSQGKKNKSKKRLYNFAYLAKVKKYALEKKKKAYIRTVIGWERMAVQRPNSKYQLTHQCGDGVRSLNCCEPEHLHVRTKRENAEHEHCHFFLKMDADVSQRFVDANLCPHEPKCFKKRNILVPVE